ncbi:MAG: hypothetical protein HUN04_13795 [Desulfobacter sp.]|nr:MAG: hypothetical protein HUN04_13795 [Desulfobacter sp.]
MGDHGENNIALADNARVIVLGGGPAGAFFAIHLLFMAKKEGRKIRVTIVDKRMGPAQDDGGRMEAPGCNFCAGVLSPRLHQGLGHYGIRLPDSVLCHKFSHIWIHGQWKNFPLKVPRGARVFSVFRGTLPGKRPDAIRGFDGFMLERAVEMGAELVRGEARDICLTREGLPRVALAGGHGRQFFLEGEFLCISTGVNDGPAGGLSCVFRSFSRLQPGFRPPATRRALVFEMKPGRAYLKKYMDRELYVIVSAGRALASELDLDHAVLVPKKDCLTVALMGKSIDRAAFPGDTSTLIQAFFSLGGVRDILPGLSAENCPPICTCTPLMSVSPARFPYAHRMVLAGDALGARLYRDGLYSAFALTRGLAGTVLGRGVDEMSLARACDAAGQWLQRDNTYGRRLMGLFQQALKSSFLSRMLYQTFATEMKFRTMDQWPVGRLLWQVGSGAEDFRSLFRTLASGRVLVSLGRGLVKTLRNKGTEWFFGLNWKGTGRYPAVVLKEKRQYLKDSVSRSLGVNLDGRPEMERMYAVKIRASARTIFKELGRFGEGDSPFLRLRFVAVARIAGAPNEEGAVVQYRLSFAPVAMDIRLAKRVGYRGLVYLPSPLFTRNGKLIFEVSPTRDGNHRLVVYTAFDYRRGNTWGTKLFWTLFRGVFPDFAHDVVWNHAVCRIKSEAERAEAGPSR